MPVPNLREQSLGNLSGIEVRFFLGESGRHTGVEILVIRYRGEYPIGSAGNGDGRYMTAMAEAGISAFNPWGVIHDLTGLNYQWGDWLENVFIGPPQNEAGKLLGKIFGQAPPAQQPAIVVGPACEEAVRTLLLGESSKEPLESIGYVFRDLDAAWAFIEAQLQSASS